MFWPQASRFTQRAQVNLASSNVLTQRHFSVSTAAQTQGGDQEQQDAGLKIEKPISHTLRNQHIRFVPQKRLNFNLETPDGRVSLIFKAGPVNKFALWDALLAICAPGTLLAPMILPPEPTLLAFSSLFLPSVSLFAWLNRRKRSKRLTREVAEAYLFENGEQLLLRMHDGVLHKVDIIHNDTHSLDENKDRSLIFIIENGGREYFINSR